MEARVQVDRWVAGVIVVVIGLFPGSAEAQQSVAQFLRAESGKTDFVNLLKREGVSVNLDGIIATPTLAIVPVKERWDEVLGTKGSAVLGANFSANVLKNIGLEPGLYVVQARRDERLGLIYWNLLSPDGKVASKPMQICVERLPEDTRASKALLFSRSPVRCCFETDRVRHCGECD